MCLGILKVQLMEPLAKRVLKSDCALSTVNVCVLSFQSRARLNKRKEELEEILHEMELRMEEEEERILTMGDEKKKMHQTVADLEDQ